MFSWFLKLLGIDEDKPAASGNSLLNTSKQSNSNDTIKETIVETTEELTPEPAPVPAPKTEPEPKSEPEPEPETISKSLTDEFPDLKANYIKVLNEAGFTNKDLIAKASDKELLDLKGIGKATLKILRA